MMLTYQTKLKNVDNNLDDFLKGMCELYSKVELNLYRDIQKGIGTRGSLKKTYMFRYGITSRHYNAIVINLEGKIDSVKELQSMYIKEVKDKIKEVDKVVKSKELQKAKLFKTLDKAIKTNGLHTESTMKIVKRYKKLKFTIHQKKRKLRDLKHRLKRLESKLNSICFGGKDLYLKQYNLDKTSYKDHKEWREDWLFKRTSQFNFVGSKDETYGNQSCTYDKDNNLKIRVPNDLVDKYGKYITIENVVFPYGQEVLDEAKESYKGYSKGGKLTTYYKAISYKFKRTKKGWYVYATVDVEEPSIVTTTKYGTIGVDLNAGFVSMCEVDRYGNYLKDKKININMYNRSTNQVKASIGDVVKEIVDYALEVNKSIGIEDLDFSKKKALLVEEDKKYSRMLSGLAYSTFKKMLLSRAKRYGVDVKIVDPSYTSIIGQVKYMRRYGISSHSSASMVIARRGMCFKHYEKCKNIRLSNKLDVTKSRKKQWYIVSRELKKNYSYKVRMSLLLRVS